MAVRFWGIVRSIPGPGPALLQGSLTGLFLRPPERGPYMDVLELSGGV